MKPIYLMGFPGSGKTTLGRELQRLTGVAFVDLDVLIEQRYGLTVSEIFKSVGEEEFRRRETSTLKSTGTMTDTIVALGGGTPCNEENLEWILTHGTAVFLDVAETKIYQRLLRGRHKRPLIAALSDEQLLTYIRDTMSRRRPYYIRATATFDANGLDEEIEREETARRFARRFGLNINPTTTPLP